jgi:hypothetical protein
MENKKCSCGKELSFKLKDEGYLYFDCLYCKKNYRSKQEESSVVEVRITRKGLLTFLVEEVSS